MSEQTPMPPLDEATLDLLIKQAVEGLEPAEQRALDALDDAQTSALARELERVAAAAVLVGLDTREPLPAGLRERIEAAAPAALASALAPIAPLASAAPPAAGRVVDLAAERERARTQGRADGPATAERRAASAAGGRAGWWAAAACLLLAVMGWWRVAQQPTGGEVALSPPSPPVAPPPVMAPPPAPAPTVERTLVEQLAALKAEPGTVDVTMAATQDPAARGVKADVLWNEKLQQGMLRVEGLSANDPAIHQYQFWIFDAGRDARYPVDGGVFDIPAGRAEVLIPIRARLAVHAPAAFAVTVEKPGGVVVSARDHVVVLGKVT
jgi:hypothetical protein